MVIATEYERARTGESSYSPRENKGRGLCLGDEVEMSILVAVGGQFVAVVRDGLTHHIIWGDEVLSSGSQMDLAPSRQNGPTRHSITVQGTSHRGGLR